MYNMIKYGQWTGKDTETARSYFLGAPFSAANALTAKSNVPSPIQTAANQCSFTPHNKEPHSASLFGRSAVAAHLLVRSTKYLLTITNSILCSGTNMLALGTPIFPPTFLFAARIRTDRFSVSDTVLTCGARPGSFRPSAPLGPRKYR